MMLMVRGYWTEEGRCSECDRKGCICPPGEGMNDAKLLDRDNVQSIVRSRSVNAKVYVYADCGYSVSCNACAFTHTGRIPDTLAGITPHMGEFSAANYILNIFNSHKCEANKRWVQTPSYTCGTAGCRGRTEHTPDCWAKAEPARCKTCGHPNGVVGNGFCGCSERVGATLGGKVADALSFIRSQNPNHEVRFEYLSSDQDYSLTVSCHRCKTKSGKRIGELELRAAVAQVQYLIDNVYELINRCMCHRGADVKQAMEKFNEMTKVIVRAWAQDVVSSWMIRFSLLELT